MADAVEMLAGPPLLHMVHSRPGATVASQVLAMATAKQRKKIIKAMKGALVSFRCYSGVIIAETLRCELVHSFALAC